jgi:two-component system, NtrC family, sensor kinase
MDKQEEQETRGTDKLSGLFNKLIHPGEFLSVKGKDPYKILKARVVVLGAILSLVPLFIVVTVSYFWFQSILKDDFRSQLRWQIENTKQSIEFFIDENLSSLRFLASAYTYEQLSDQKTLSNTFMNLKKEMGGLVDIGLIDSDGIQRSYVGPYKLEGKDYSNQDWFQEVIVRNVYVSDVFMGYRKIPHFAIAIKKELPEKGTFWILRATIDMETLKRYASAINLQGNDDAFIIDSAGILQTTSRFHGKVLDKLSLPLPAFQRELSLLDIKEQNGAPAIFGYSPIKNSPWALVALIQSTHYMRIPKIFKNELLVFTLITMLIGISVASRVTTRLVNRIKEAEQEREDAIAQSEHAGKLASIGRLASGVAHEINNPLAVINEKSGLMKDILEMSGDLQENKERFLTLLGSITDSINRCRTITQRLLGFSRRMEVSHDLIDLNDTIKEVIGFLEKEILFRNIRLELTLAEDLPKIVSDKGQLQQVFLNIINNAMDALREMKEGRITVSTGVKDQGMVGVIITDNGHGIPKEKIKHIFEPFYTTKEKGQGTGLGLFISYGIIRRLGGSIIVESEIDKGTVFNVDLPIDATAG